MDRVHTFVRSEVLASYFENMWDAALSVLASNFAVTQLDATHLRVPASAGVGAAVIAIQGRPRYVEANVDRAHPGGAAGAYDVFVTAADQNVVNVPAPYTDNTNYAFDLAIVAAGATPAIVAGVVDVYRRVASCQWDGAQITQLDPVGNVTVAGIPSAGPAGQAGLRKLDQTATGATAGNDSRVPTQSENDALQGTSGAPANGNRFVTDADPRNTNQRTPADGTVTEAKLAVAVDTLLKQRGYYGDGSDGAFTLDGAATPAWATRAGSVYTMTRDCYCTNLTVNAGVTLIRAGFVVFCTGTYTTAATAIDQANGGNGGNGSAAAAGAAGASPSAAGARYVGVAGAIGAFVSGGATANGGAGASASAPLAASGAAGAGGAVGGLVGGAGGTDGSIAGGPLRLATAVLSGLVYSVTAAAVQRISGASSGGSGAATSATSASGSGGGGGGGGILIVAAQTIVNNGALQANGGNGGNGGGHDAGGGGGGNGGYIVLVSASITGAGTTSAAAGLGGAGVGTGLGGGDGKAGRVIQALG